MRPGSAFAPVAATLLTLACPVSLSAQIAVLTLSSPPASAQAALDRKAEADSEIADFVGWVEA